MPKAPQSATPFSGHALGRVGAAKALEEFEVAAAHKNEMSGHQSAVNVGIPKNCLDCHNMTQHAKVDRITV